MKKYNKKWWYSIIMAILMVWFMLVLTSWVFWLILWESKDTKTMEYYLKSYQAAEWWIELALLKAKDSNYSLDETITKNDSISKIFWKNWNFSRNKDVLLTYDLSSTSSWITDKVLESWEFNVIPLLNVKNPNFSLSWDADKTKIVRNIVWKDSWISWVWEFQSSTPWYYKTISDEDWTIDFNNNKTVSDFLANSSWNYLIIQNVDESKSIKYSLKSLNSWEKFTTDNTTIIASWDIWWYKQNLRLIVNNWEYLSLLKYSIFSPEN